MKVRKRTGRGKAAPVVDRPVRVRQHSNSWAQVDYLDDEGGHEIVNVTMLVLEDEQDLNVFHPELDNHGRLWDDFKLKTCDDGTFMFVPRPPEEVRKPGRSRVRPLD